MGIYLEIKLELVELTCRETLLHIIWKDIDVGETRELVGKMSYNSLEIVVAFPHRINIFSIIQGCSCTDTEKSRDYKLMLEDYEHPSE